MSFDQSVVRANICIMSEIWTFFQKSFDTKTQFFLLIYISFELKMCSIISLEAIGPPYSLSFMPFLYRKYVPVLGTEVF